MRAWTVSVPRTPNPGRYADVHEPLAVRVRIGGAAAGRAVPAKPAAVAVVVLAAALLAAACAAPEPHGVLAETAASTSMRAERRGNREPAVVSFACAEDGTVAGQLLWAEVPDGERTSTVAWTRPGGGTGGAQALDFADGRAEVAAAGRWLDQAVRADAATVEIDGMEPLVFHTRRHRLALAEFRDRCAGMADANGEPMRTASGSRTVSVPRPVRGPPG